jgi:hypothetical protein
MNQYEFELQQAKALLAAERDQRKRRILLERVSYYQFQVDRIEQHQGRRNESGR